MVREAATDHDVRRKHAWAVMLVQPGAEAAQHALQALDGEAVGGVDDLLRLLNHSRVNRDVKVTVVRKGEVREVRRARQAGVKKPVCFYAAAPSAPAGAGCPASMVDVLTFGIVSLD